MLCRRMEKGDGHDDARRRKNVMSKYEEELRQRLASGEDVEDIARWFTERMAEGPAPDLSEFEVKFFKRIVAAFLQWQSKRKLH
jgi:hypothetical protein